MKTLKSIRFASVERANAGKAGEGEGPKWNKLFPLGATKFRADFPNGKLTFDKAFLTTMASNYVAMGKPRLKVDYFHRGHSAEDGVSIDDKVASGKIIDVELREDGLYGLFDWTSRARDYIHSEEIDQLSPEFHPNFVSRDTGKPQGPTLLGAGLLNDPFLKELPRVAATDFEPSTGHPLTSKEGFAPMDKKLICAALGIPDDTADDAVMAKLTDVVSKSAVDGKSAEDAKAETAVAKASDSAKALKLSEVEGVVTKLSDDNKALAAQVSTLQSEKRATEVSAFFGKLVTEGRVTPAMRTGLEAIALKDGIEAVRFLESSAPVVSMTEKGVPGAVVPEDKKAAALKRWNTRMAELQGKGMKFTDANTAAKGELPEEFSIVFG